MISKKAKKQLSLSLSIAMALSCFTGVGRIVSVKAEGTLAQDLFISEYLEGSSNNKALEIFNGTGKDVDLTGYKVELYANGATTVNNKLELSGTLKNGEVYVITNSGAAIAKIIEKSNTTSTVTYFNGDDAVVLKHNEVIIDSIGKVGERPTTGAWGANKETLDHTLIRKSTVTTGDANSSDSFDPTIEWVVKDKDYVDDLGKHTMDGFGGGPVIVLLKSISLPATAEVEEGNDVTLALIYDPVDTTEKEVQWTSSDDTIASVTNGKITGHKAGTAVITATSKVHTEIKSQTTVTVKEPGDTTAPVITKLEPDDGAVIPETTPVQGIRVEFNDGNGKGIDTTKTKLIVDQVDVTSSATASSSSTVSVGSFSYAAPQPFTKGNHTVTIEIVDLANNKTTKSWSFTVGQSTPTQPKQYSFYYGQLHAHTNLSDGTGTPDEAYAWARDNANADYVALTDHSNWFDNDKASENITDVSQSTSTEWKQLHESADKFTRNGEFIGIAGFEMTWSGSTGGWGHINTFNTPWFASRSNSAMDLKTYYNKIAGDTNSISQLNHPGKTFGDFADFGFYSVAADNVVNMIEVGNGEGPVRGSGYFPSYEYYTRALDKGWHLAPTNNQDNHKGKWVNANTSRTVMLAENLTRDSLYDAMRNRRIYSTEDENLKISYTVNDNPMGSILSNAGVLNAKIKIEDPDASDVIGKVSIIVNGGAVAASKTFTGNTAEWDLVLPEGNTYYYVRVDQGDKDIAVTAPVWAGSVVPVGISKLEVSQNPQIVNNPVDVTATVYNNGTSALNNVKVEFFKDSIETANKIGEGIVESVASAGTGTAKISWTPTTTGEIKLYAKTTITIDGKENNFTNTTSINVGTSDELVKVVIDGGHQNQYVSGDYKGKMLTLADTLQEKGFMLVQNNDELTASDLEHTKILIITDPQSKDDTKYGLTKSNFTDSEIEVIKNFVKLGGNLIITSRADYNDKGVTDPSYESSKQGNRVLEAVGSNLRFNDDEVIDKVLNGGAGQEYRLYFNKYVGSKYNLTTNIIEGYTYSAYSGCSVILKSNGDERAVDWLVKGHDSTEILDSDLQNDAVQVQKGNVYSLAAEKLANGSKIVVAGTTFFSDFETAANDNAYSNKQITENVINWMSEAAPAELKTIAEVRADADKNGEPDNLGKRFAIEGIVTAQSEAISPKNAFFEVIYIQDATGGITVFGVSKTALKLGQKVKITGFVDSYGGDAELQVNNETKDVQLLDSSINIVAPKVMTTGDSMKDENEGWLVLIKGKVTKIEGQNIYVNDGTGEARAYVEGYINDGSGDTAKNGKWDSSIKVGDTVSIVGLASEDPEGHRLRVRNTTEIVKVNVELPDTTAPVITISGAENGVKYVNVSVVPIISVNEEATVSKVLDGKNYDGKAITASGTHKLVVTAVDKAGNQSVKEMSFTIEVLVSKDAEKTAEAIKQMVSNAKADEKIVISAQENPVLDAKVFAALKDIDKPISFVVESQGMKITWTFNGKDIKNTNTSVDLTLNAEAPNKTAIAVLDANAQIISFKNHGELPAPMTITIPVDTKKFDVSKPLYFYYYNETTKQPEKIGEPLKAYKNGDAYFVDVVLTHNSDYFMTANELPKIVTGTEGTTTLPKTGSSVDMNVLLSFGLLFIAAGFVFIRSKKRKIQ